MAHYFSKEHEWVKVDGTLATVGITDYAQSQLGDIVFVETPDIGAQLKKGDDCAVVESVKAASDVYTPVSGTVTQANGNVEEDPALVNTAAEGEGWLFTLEMSDSAELEALMDAAAYKAYVESL